VSTSAQQKTEAANLNQPSETRSFDRGKVEVVEIGGGTVGRLTLEPGWRWSEHVKPIAKTEFCEAPHFQYQVSGTLHVLMADGEEYDFVAGTVALVPSGHDAWVVGDEDVVLIDWNGATTYARG
jgi:quercetin dioxygenase-like cupin family protein